LLKLYKFVNVYRNKEEERERTALRDLAKMYLSEFIGGTSDD
jgi:hypothetical protein